MGSEHSRKAPSRQLVIGYSEHLPTYERANSGECPRHYLIFYRCFRDRLKFLGAQYGNEDIYCCYSALSLSQPQVLPVLIVAHFVARRLAVRRPRDQISAVGTLSTELTGDEERWRGTSAICDGSMYLLYECD